jgi:hypothetical protein
LTYNGCTPIIKRSTTTLTKTASGINQGILRLSI